MHLIFSSSQKNFIIALNPRIKSKTSRLNITNIYGYRPIGQRAHYISVLKSLEDPTAKEENKTHCIKLLYLQVPGASSARIRHLQTIRLSTSNDFRNSKREGEVASESLSKKKEREREKESVCVQVRKSIYIGAIAPGSLSADRGYVYREARSIIIN